MIRTKKTRMPTPATRLRCFASFMSLDGGRRGEVSGREVCVDSAISAPSRVADPRVEEAVRDVDEKVDDEDAGGEDEHARLRHHVVALRYRLD